MKRDHPPIFVLRHGETQWNTELRLQGTLDSPLTERGLLQARAMGEALARALRRETIEPGQLLWFASPLGRTQQTAAAIAEAAGVPDAPWQADHRLAELRYGEWEGLQVREIEVLTPGAMARWRSDPLVFTPPGGETHLELRQRTAQFLEDALALDRALVIVGHGVAGAMLRGLYLGLTPAEIFVLEKPQDAFFRLHKGVAMKIGVIDSG